MQTKSNIICLLKANKSTIASYGIKKVGLFGSYAREEQTKDSDIDILVEFYPDQENFDNLMAVCDFFEKLFKGQEIEIVTTNGLSEYIGPRILKEVQYV